MIIIKKENAYSYHFESIECECQQISISEDDIPYFDVIFKIKNHPKQFEQHILVYVLNVFSQLCSEKSYFVPHFYFRIKDIILIMDNKEESLLLEQDFITLQKIHTHFFFSGDPLLWKSQIHKIAF